MRGSTRFDTASYFTYLHEAKASNPHTSHTQSAGGAEKVTQNASIMERNRREALLSAATTTTASLCCGVSINLSTFSKPEHFRCEGLHVPVLVSSEPLLSTFHSRSDIATRPIIEGSTFAHCVRLLKFPEWIKDDRTEGEPRLYLPSVGPK